MFFILQIFSLWWFNWLIYLRLLFVLLLRSLRYVWVYANIIFLRLHGLCLLWLLPDAWSYWFSSSFAFCAPHISVYQVRVVLGIHHSILRSRVVFLFQIHRFLCRKVTCSFICSFLVTCLKKGTAISLGIICSKSRAAVWWQDG